MDELIRAAAGGSTQAFSSLVEQYQKQVYNLCLRMVKDPNDAADLSQETFFNIWKGLPRFQFNSSFSTWVYRLASNVCLDFLRSKKRRNIVSVTFSQEDNEKQPELLDPADGPEALTIQADNLRRITAALNELDEEYRLALTLRAVQQFSYSEISQIMGIKEGTVKSRIARAREQMRKKLLLTGNKTESAASISGERGMSE